MQKTPFQWRSTDRIRSRFRLGRSINRASRHQFLSAQSPGFTLTEVLVVITIIGLLLGIAGPSWLGWHTKNLLRTAQDEVFQAMRQTQLQAIQSRQTWRISFRTNTDRVEWAMHLAASPPPDSLWQPLHPKIRLAPETTLKQATQVYFVEFNHKGNVTPPFGRLSLTSSQGDRHRSCVFVSTLLGAMRKATDQNCY